MTYGQPFVGTDVGPELLRKAGLRPLLSALGWRVQDIGDLQFENMILEKDDEINNSFTGNAKNSHHVGAGAKKVYESVLSSLQQRRFPLVLGGDHSIGLGSVAAVLQHNPQTGIIWVDAHADLNTPFISETGNMHGMPVGMLMGHNVGKDSHTTPGCQWLEHIPKLDPSQVVYIGLRDVDGAERKIIQDLNICAYTMHEIDRYGIGHVMEMAFHHLLDQNPNRPLHLSYDIDSVDPVLAPATGTTVRGGLNFREAHYVAEAVALTGNLASADVVEVNPMLSNGEGADETVELGIQIITSLMGKSII
jgi:arginase